MCICTYIYMYYKCIGCDTQHVLWKYYTRTSQIGVRYLAADKVILSQGNLILSAAHNVGGGGCIARPREDRRIPISHQKNTSTDRRMSSPRSLGVNQPSQPAQAVFKGATTEIHRCFCHTSYIVLGCLSRS